MNENLRLNVIRFYPSVVRWVLEGLVFGAVFGAVIFFIDKYENDKYILDAGSQALTFSVYVTFSTLAILLLTSLTARTKYIEISDDSFTICYRIYGCKSVLYKNIQKINYPHKLGYFLWRVKLVGDLSYSFIHRGEFSGEENRKIYQALSEKLAENGIAITKPYI